MASLIAKIFVAALAAGAVHALPQNIQNTTPVSSAVSSPSPAPPAANNDALIKELKGTSTTLKRFQKLLLADDKTVLKGDALAKQVVFDFDAKKAVAPGAKGGATASANIDTFPILTELGISTTVGFLEPCGMNSPHVHPRATEFLTVTEGQLEFGFILENKFADSGSNEVTGTLKKYQGTVFNQGSIHYQFNNFCEPATFVATLNSEDPGTSQVAQNFLGLNGEVVRVALGFPKAIDASNIDELRKNLPANLVQAVDTCLKKCKKN